MSAPTSLEQDFGCLRLALIDLILALGKYFDVIHTPVCLTVIALLLDWLLPLISTRKNSLVELPVVPIALLLI